MRYWPVWLLPGAAALGFAVLWAADANRVLFLALNRLGPLTSDWFWTQVTVLGDTLVALALCLPLWRRRPDLVWALVYVVVLGTLWVHGLKPFLDVARPPAVLGDAVHVIGEAYRSQSFPSGHATTAFAIGGLYALGVGSRPLAALAVGIAILVAASRAVVGVHWPLDLLAGAFGGWLAAAGALALGRATWRTGQKEAVQWLLGIGLALCAAALVLADLVLPPLGPIRDYPQATPMLRVLAICCLAAAATRLSRASQHRHPGL